MTDSLDSKSPSETPIPSATRTALLSELQGFEHLLLEPMTQVDLGRLYVLYEAWVECLGDSPEAVVLCNGLGDFIDACIEDDWAADDALEQAYFDLVVMVHEGGR